MDKTDTNHVTNLVTKNIENIDGCNNEIGGKHHPVKNAEEINLNIEILRDETFPGYVFIKDEEWCKILGILCKTTNLNFVGDRKERTNF